MEIKYLDKVLLPEEFNIKFKGYTFKNIEKAIKWSRAKGYRLINLCIYSESGSDKLPKDFRDTIVSESKDAFCLLAKNRCLLIDLKLNMVLTESFELFSDRGGIISFTYDYELLYNDPKFNSGDHVRSTAVYHRLNEFPDIIVWLHGTNDTRGYENRNDKIGRCCHIYYSYIGIGYYDDESEFYDDFGYPMYANPSAILELIK